MTLYLITFAGCPNAEKAKTLLGEAGLKYTEIKRDDLTESHPHLRYSSPSLLDGEKLIFGSFTDSNAGGCTLSIPNVMELMRRLEFH